MCGRPASRCTTIRELPSGCDEFVDAAPAVVAAAVAAVTVVSLVPDGGGAGLTGDACPALAVAQSCFERGRGFAGRAPPCAAAVIATVAHVAADVVDVAGAATAAVVVAAVVAAVASAIAAREHGNGLTVPRCCFACCRCCCCCAVCAAGPEGAGTELGVFLSDAAPPALSSVGPPPTRSCFQNSQ